MHAIFLVYNSSIVIDIVDIFYYPNGILLCYPSVELAKTFVGIL